MKITFLLLVTIIQVNSKDSDGNTDENRPYKFAFDIEGYQHRSEEKDEKGIIKGEYGFVTGDGVYHVTVYATDENGNFRIVSMKNFYIGLPMEQTTKNTPTTQHAELTTQKSQPTVRKLDGIQGCGGCLVPTTTTRTNEIDIRSGENESEPEIQKKDRLDPPQSQLMMKYFPKNILVGKKNERPALKQDQTSSKPPDFQMQLPVTFEKETKPSNTPQIPKIQNDTKMNKLQSRDPSGLLYEFNQTQTYQGHHEKGFVDNSKQGDYFVNGRDGIQQIVEYSADESGYQPHIRFQNISASETPNHETEIMYNVLKGVYFKWFYNKR